MMRAAPIFCSEFVSIALLLGAVLGRWSYDYYTLLRFVVFGTAVYLAVMAILARNVG